MTAFDSVVGGNIWQGSGSIARSVSGSPLRQRRN